MHNAPQHIAVIPDGNRRWARARGLSAPEGHREGIANVGRIARAAWALGAETFTFWWGSPANLTKRTPEEVAAITSALSDWLAGEGAALIAEHDVHFEIYGRWHELCPNIAPGVVAATDAAGEGPRRLVVLMGYDGREEILAAAESLSGAGESAEAFGRAMWTGSLPPVDLLIRTGGEPHLSAGFLLWRIAEAQLAWPEEMWPAFGAEQLKTLVERYAGTERRFGA